MKINMITPVNKDERTGDSIWAERYLRIQINELKNRYYDLIYALYALEPVEIEEEYPFLTDTHHLFYNAKILRKMTGEEIKRSILHIALHGLMGHFEMDRNIPDQELLWAVMDIKVRRLMDLFVDGKKKGFEEELLQMEVFQEARKNEALKRFLMDRGKKVYVDDHGAWHMIPTPMLGVGGKDWDEVRKNTRELLKGQGKDGQGKDGDMESLLMGLACSGGRDGSYGTEPGSGRMDILEGKKGTLDYRSVLSELKKNGLKTGEEDIPDPVYYCYGLELYEDVPLVEPLEESEREVIDTLVIVVDTSGSCMGDLPDFLAETKSLLKDLGRTVQVNKICYLECDTRITTESLLTADSAQDFLSEHHSFTGGGGTDFRPVFEKIKEYEKKGDRIGGLIYYSDGEGAYPMKKPEYPCFFVGPKNISSVNSYMNPYIPDWVRQVSL